MTTLKLKIGHIYRSRDRNEKTKIVRKAEKTDPVYRKTHPFVDSEGYAYMPDGRTDSVKTYPFDLVKFIR
jgi:hypothetical protein